MSVPMSNKESTMPLPQSVEECMTLVPLSSIDPDDQECSICKSPMDDINNIHDDIENQHFCAKLVVCRHTFGEPCILQWLGNSTTCPACRTVVYEYNKPVPAWTIHTRGLAIATLEALLDDDTLCAAIAHRAIDLIVNNTAEHKSPRIFAWWDVMRRLASIPRLAAESWAGYVEWLEKDVIWNWEHQVQQYWALDWREREEVREMEEEARPLVAIMRREVECCREIMGWEALPGF